MYKGKIIGYSAILVACFSLLYLYFPIQSPVKQAIDNLFTNFSKYWYNIFGFAGLVLLFGLVLYFGITFFGLLEPLPRINADYFPKISIIIASKNEAPLLRQTLDSLVASDYPTDNLQVIIVTSGSTDGSEVFCQNFATEHPNIDWLVISEDIPKKGKPPALNVGLQYVKYDYLVLFDSGNILMPDTIKNLIAPMKNEKVHAAMGTIMVKNWNKNALTKAILVDYSLVSGGNTFFEAKSKMGTNCYIYGRNFCVRMDFLREIGGFDEDSLIEDMYLAAMLNIHHKKIMFVPSAKIYEPVPSDWNILKRQRMRWVGGFTGDLPRIMQFKEGNKEIGKSVGISRFISMILMGNVTIWALIDIIALIIQVLIQEYYMLTWTVIVLIFHVGILLHSIQKYGDKHYTCLFYYPLVLRLHFFMSSLAGKLPKNISWEQTPQLLSMSKEELEELASPEEIAVAGK